MYCCFKKIVLELFSVFVCLCLCDFGLVCSADGKIKCDCIFSVGPACRPAQWLRKTKKRFQSSPLDWMMKYSLDAALHLFENKFEDFFEDVEATGEIIGNSRVVKDKKNGMVSMHHFKRGISLYDAKNEVRNMMLRRAKEVDKIMKKSDSITLLCNRQKDSHDELKKFIIGFSKLYPDKNINLINIHSNNSNDVTQETIYRGEAATKKSTKKKSKGKNTAKKKTKKQSKKLRVIKYSFKDVSPDTRVYPEWEGNPFGWQKVIDDIELTDKCFNKDMDFKQVEF